MQGLCAYGLSLERGFLPELKNISRLPSTYEPLEHLLDSLPKLVANKTLREEVYRLPALSTRELKTEEHWRRAYMVLTFLSQAYLRVEGDAHLPQVLPSTLAIPWCAAAKHLGLPTVVTYSGLVLFNFQLKDPVGIFEESDIKILHTFTGTKDEEWFYKSFLLVEIAFIPGINAIVEALAAMCNGDDQKLTNCLELLSSSVKGTTMALKRLGQECTPEVFFRQMRPFYAGTRKEDGFKNGLLFEGVTEEQKGYAGTSAAQSSVLSTFDIFLGVEHKDSFFEEQQQYRPPLHRLFLEDLAQQPSLRHHVMSSGNTKLVASYNRCITELSEFRTQHLILVTRFIINPSHQYTRKHRGASQPLKGTAGTSLSTFLRESRDETLKYIIK